MLRSLINIIGILFIPIIAILFFYILTQYYFAYWYTHPYYYYFILSVIIGCLFFYRMLKKDSFYSIFRHELCHWLVSVLCFNKPKGFNVSSNGSGRFTYEGKGNIFINLAPYYLPITTLFFILLQFLMSTKPQWYFIVVGIAFSFDVVSAAKDYKSYQQDWKDSGGVIISVVLSLSLAIFYVISFLTILFKGLEGYTMFLQRVWMVLNNFFIR